MSFGNNVYGKILIYGHMYKQLAINEQRGYIAYKWENEHSSKTFTFEKMQNLKIISLEDLPVMSL